jgi:hypothetical protein
MREVFLYVAMAFALMFAGMTVAVIAESGVDVLTVLGILVVLMLGLGIFGAIRNPPDE